MINLVLNTEIRSRTTYEIPVLFGNPQMNKKKLYSYSVFNESVCDEIIFDDKSVAKHIYDSNCFLKSSIMYNSENVIVKSLKFEFLDKDEKGFNFIDWTPGGMTGNNARYYYDDSEKNWKLMFRRVDTFLGYKVFAVFKVNEKNDPIEESYLKSNFKDFDPILERLFIHSYEYKSSDLDRIHKYIMEYGWDLSSEMQEYILNQ
ncbi:MAG: hypothetical protein Q8R90_09570 [Bacteroidales bacterium]|nr:hypothetical protein [Bacteroidales bacterium]